jgi:hypothetical protein
MRKVKTIASRITVDFLLSGLAVLAAITLYRAMTWHAYCEGRTITWFGEIRAGAGRIRHHSASRDLA